MAGYAAYFFTATQGEKRFNRLAFIAILPAGTLNYFCGQNGFFSAALIIGGFTQLENRPVLSGVLFGLLTLKPQLGSLLPVVLILSGNRRCFAAASATAILLAALTTAIYGVHIWAWIIPRQRRGAGAKQHFARHSRPVGAGDADSVHEMRGCLASRLALPGWGAGALFAGGASGSDLDLLAQTLLSLSCAVFLAATFLFTPYAFVYDMVAFGWLFAKLSARGDGNLIHDLLMISIWSMPIITTPYPYYGEPALSLFLMILLIRLLWAS